MIHTKLLPQSDVMGAAASGLCMIHCIATPFLFVAHTCSVTGCCTATTPGWWSFLDYLFIGITFLAVFFSARNTSKSWMKHALYASWVLLTAAIINEKMALVQLAETWKYGIAIILVGLHVYNRRYCQCKEEACCAV